MSPRTLSPPVHVPIVDDAPMNLMQAVDAWLAEFAANGRINSQNTSDEMAQINQTEGGHA